MSSDETASADMSTETTDAQAQVERLEAHLSPEDPLLTERLSTVRAGVIKYERAETESDEQDALDTVEAELEKARDAIEREVDEGKRKAFDRLDDLEERISELRN